MKPVSPWYVQAGTDVAATLTAWGSWQPAMMPTRSPTVVNALVGSLGGHGADRRVSFQPSLHPRSHCPNCRNEAHLLYGGAYFPPARSLPVPGAYRHVCSAKGL